MHYRDFATRPTLDMSVTPNTHTLARLIWALRLKRNMEYIRARKFRRDEMCNTISKLDIRYYRWILEISS